MCKVRSYNTIFKRICLIFILLGSLKSQAQSFNQEKINLSNFITRMCQQESWTGVKVFKDYDNTYLISVVSLEPKKYNSENAMIRVAEIKSRSQANQFLKGSYISMESFVSISKDNPDSKTQSLAEVQEQIREFSMGYAENMELLNTFSNTEKGTKVFIYIKRLETKTDDSKKK